MKSLRLLSTVKTCCPSFKMELIEFLIFLSMFSMNLEISLSVPPLTRKLGSCPKSPKNSFKMPTSLDLVFLVMTSCMLFYFPLMHSECSKNPSKRSRILANWSGRTDFKKSSTVMASYFLRSSLPLAERFFISEKMCLL